MQKLGESDFYKNLKKPQFQPPAWLFTPVWMIIYLLLFVSLMLIINAPTSPYKNYAYLAFAIQMILNFSWMPVFYKERKICPAFVISILLFLSIIAMMIIYYKISIIAALLQIPYLLWSIYAAAINFYICKAN